MALLKGTPPKLFLAAIFFLIVGTLLMIKAEALSGWANVGKANTIVPIGIVSLVLGGIFLVLMLVVGFKGSKK